MLIELRTLATNISPKQVRLAQRIIGELNLKFQALFSIIDLLAAAVPDSIGSIGRLKVL